MANELEIQRKAVDALMRQKEAGDAVLAVPANASSYVKTFNGWKVKDVLNPPIYRQKLHGSVAAHLPASHHTRNPSRAYRRMQASATRTLSVSTAHNRCAMAQSSSPR